MENRSTPARKFYYSPGGDEIQGPFVLLEMAGLLRGGHITGETLTLKEGEETWQPFLERPEYGFAREIPQDAVDRHVKELTASQESSFSPRKLAVFAWVMAPVLLACVFFVVRYSLRYEHEIVREEAPLSDSSTNSDTNAAPGDAPGTNAP